MKTGLVDGELRRNLESDVDARPARRNGAPGRGRRTVKRISCSFILVCLFLNGARAQQSLLQRKISVEYRKAALEEVFKDLERKTGVSITFAGKTVKDRAPVTCAIRDTAAGRILNRILRRRGLKLKSAEGRLAAVVRHNWYTPFTTKEEVYEFARKPTVTKLGRDTYAIEFETRGFCDCTIAIEDARGRVRRHLASGLLGANAPEPFAWNSKQQRVVWDGKDDRGQYLEDRDDVRVRVSLGLKARFERTLHWSPYRRMGFHCPLIAASADGVYVFNGHVADMLRVYDHGGRYLRTVYPFPAARLSGFKDLHWHRFPQDGARLPLREGYYHRTLLSSGPQEGFAGFGVDRHRDCHGPLGNAALAMCTGRKQVLLGWLRLNRFGTDGGSLGVPVKGGRVTTLKGEALPHSMCLSADGKWVYLAGYARRRQAHWGKSRSWRTFSHVARMSLSGRDSKDASVFLGHPTAEKSDNSHFNQAVDVTCDPQGRILVADYGNSRVQVFTAQGKHLKTISTPHPARVRVHPETGEVYVFSWPLFSAWAKTTKVRPLLHKYESVERPRLKARYPLPGVEGAIGGTISATIPGVHVSVELDAHAAPPVIWIGQMYTRHTFSGWSSRSGSRNALGALGDVWKMKSIRLLQEQEGRLKVIREFGKDLLAQTGTGLPPINFRRVYCNPANGRLYVAEDNTGYGGKRFDRVYEYLPDTGERRLVKLPFSPEDMAFDLEGHAYLRVPSWVARFDARTWREVPFDYGEPRGKLISVLTTPFPASVWHSFGLWVAPDGKLVVAGHMGGWATAKGRDGRDPYDRRFKPEKINYRVPLFPGRAYDGASGLVFVYDKHGRIVHKDAAPGLPALAGVMLDRDENLYALVSANRMVEGRVDPAIRVTGTLVKFRPGTIRAISSGKTPVPLAREGLPPRAPDLLAGRGGAGKMWIDGAEWFYGGVGYSGDTGAGSVKCSCPGMRAAMDGHNRLFVPETQRCSVAVLDSDGNLIARIGRYGNVDDGVPLVKAGGPASPRAMGGDEVALFYAPYVAVHSDRRLFISDIGNQRVLSVKLDYHLSHRLELPQPGR